MAGGLTLTKPTQGHLNAHWLTMMLCSSITLWLKHTDEAGKCLLCPLSADIRGKLSKGFVSTTNIFPITLSDGEGCGKIHSIQQVFNSKPQKLHLVQSMAGRTIPSFLMVFTAFRLYTVLYTSRCCFVWSAQKVMFCTVQMFNLTEEKRYKETDSLERLLLENTGNHHQSWVK